MAMDSFFSDAARSVSDTIAGLTLLFEREVNLQRVQSLLAPWVNNNDEDNLLQKFLKAQAIHLSSRIGMQSMNLLRNLVNNRYEYLRSNNPPRVSWSVPIPRNKEIRPELGVFLRSEQREFIQRGLNDVRHARNYAAKYLNDAEYGTSTEVGGSGSNAYVRVTKVSRPYERVLTQRMNQHFLVIEPIWNHFRTMPINDNDIVVSV